MSEFVLKVDRHGTTQQMRLPEGRSLVGRAHDCDIVLEDASVSRQHAAILVTGGRVQMTDLGSSNHTFLNGRSIQQANVAVGDTVVFGSVSATLGRTAAQSVDVSPHVVVRRVDDLSFVTERTSVIDMGRLVGLLSEIARTLVGSFSLLEILTRVIDLLIANIRAERVHLLMVDQETGGLAPALVRRADGEPAGDLVVSMTAIEMAIRDRVAIVTLNALVDARFDGAQSILASDVRSLMCAPLYDADRLIGVLYVDNAAARQFGEADLELFTALANYAAVAIARALLAEQLSEERRRRERLERYHSPAVIERILARSGADTLAAQELDITVLFADIVEFTTMAESMRPADVATLLNTFLSRTVEAIFAEQGTIDKFLGDAILAVFGAPVEQPDHALRAVQAAKAMRGIVSALNDERAFPHMRVRYAINTGVAIVGDIGSAKRQEYTVLGDVVNIAARLKSIAQPDQVLVSRATYDRLQSPVAATPLGEFTVRGRVRKIEVLSIDA
jgi:adenylate cyclase